MRFYKVEINSAGVERVFRPFSMEQKCQRWVIFVSIGHIRSNYFPQKLKKAKLFPQKLSQWKSAPLLSQCRDILWIFHRPVCQKYICGYFKSFHSRGHDMTNQSTPHHKIITLFAKNSVCCTQILGRVRSRI